MKKKTKPKKLRTWRIRGWFCERSESTRRIYENKPDIIYCGASVPVSAVITELPSKSMKRRKSV